MEVAQLNRDAGYARKDAADALKQAGEANSNAAQFNNRAAVAEENAGQARLTAAKVESSNLALQLELEKIKAPRIIKPEMRVAFISLLQNAPKGPVRFGLRHPDAETQNYAKQINSMLVDAGFTEQSVYNYPDNLIRFPPDADIALIVDTMENRPVYAEPIFNALSAIGLKPGWSITTTNRLYSPTEGHGASNEVIIFIGEKPQNY